MEFLQDGIVFDTTTKHANVDVVCGMRHRS